MMGCTRPCLHPGARVEYEMRSEVVSAEGSYLYCCVRSFCSQTWQHNTALLCLILPRMLSAETKCRERERVAGRDQHICPKSSVPYMQAIASACLTSRNALQYPTDTAAGGLPPRWQAEHDTMSNSRVTGEISAVLNMRYFPSPFFSFLFPLACSSDKASLRLNPNPNSKTK